MWIQLMDLNLWQGCAEEPGENHCIPNHLGISRNAEDGTSFLRGWHFSVLEGEKSVSTPYSVKLP